MNTKTVRLGTLLVLCLALGIALVPPVQAAEDQDEVCIEDDTGDKICVCNGSNKTKFHDKDSGFELQAHCKGKIQWTLTLVGDVVLDEGDIFLTFTIATEGNTILDTTILISRGDNLVQRELRLRTKNGDKIQVTFTRGMFENR